LREIAPDRQQDADQFCVDFNTGSHRVPVFRMRAAEQTLANVETNIGDGATGAFAPSLPSIRRNLIQKSAVRPVRSPVISLR
jgi:hypothetical protein